MVTAARAPLRVDRLRALNVPRQVAVALDAHGHPRTITDERERAVVSIGEVWRVDDEWWRRPISRQYFDVVLEGGRHLVLYEDLTTNQWWMQQP